MKLHQYNYTMHDESGTPENDNKKSCPYHHQLHQKDDMQQHGMQENDLAKSVINYDFKFLQHQNRKAAEDER